MSCHEPYTPTPEQISDATKALRLGWSVKDELRHQVGFVQSRPRFGPFPDSVFGPADWSEKRT